jgi:signal transduction histidine kinase
VKFTGSGGRVTVRTRAEGEQFFRIEVEDTGVGIQHGEIARLFEAVHETGAVPSKTTAGSRMGLALTRRIVEAQGGQVGVKSALGKGSTFHAILPRHSIQRTRSSR